jgi:amidohydrolase
VAKIMITTSQYQALENEIISAIDKASDELIEISRDIHAHPEVMFTEKYASKRLTTKLADVGFEVERGSAGLETAFVARTGHHNGPTIGFVAEYDALPEIGHACGHNLIGTAALAAGIAMNSVIDRLPGQIVVFGTPAEEGGNGKGKMIEGGSFKGVDAVMMIHGAMENVIKPVFLAVKGMEVAFHGRPSHAAASPEAGLNALDAVVVMYNSIAVLRQQVRSDARIHCVITNGGGAANIIPAYASARVVARALDMKYVEELLNRLKVCAEAAAMATGTRVEININLGGAHSVASNNPMAELYGEKLAKLGLKYETRQKDGPASTDFGILSHTVPGIHPLIQIADYPTTWHTPEFRDAAWSERGHSAMLVAAKCMALTALDLLVKPELLEKVKADFKSLA